MSNPIILSPTDQEVVSNGIYHTLSSVLSDPRNNKNGLVTANYDPNTGQLRPIQFEKRVEISKADYERQKQWEEAQGVSLGEYLEKQSKENTGMPKKPTAPKSPDPVTVLQQQVAQLAQAVANLAGVKTGVSAVPMANSDPGDQYTTVAVPLVGGAPVQPLTVGQPTPANYSVATQMSLAGPNPVTTGFLAEEPIDLTPGSPDQEPGLDLLGGTYPDPSMERAQKISGEVQERLRHQAVELVFNRFLTDVFHKKLGLDSWQPGDRTEFTNLFRQTVTNTKLVDALCRWSVGTIDSTTVTEKHVSALVVIVAGILAFYKQVLSGYVEE